MAKPVIAIIGVTKIYRLGDVEVHALRKVDLTVQRGEFLAIMGASGSGKSTLMNLLGCLDRPTGGTYVLDGVDIASLDEPALARIRSERIGFVFQNFNLLPRTSAMENVTLPLFYSARTREAEAKAKGKAVLARLGLTGRERSHPSQLSGGQQQRVAIARALINDPAILLADEPTGNLDSVTAAEIMETIRALNRDQGVTVILVTHEADMAAYADRVITMRDGLIVSDTGANRPPPETVPPPAQLPEAEGPAALAFARMALGAAARAIARNTLRSALTMLGIFIGVAALIAMVGVGQGANVAVRQQIESLGTNLLIVIPGATTAGGLRAGSGSATRLSVSDAEAIRRDASSVLEVAYVTRQVAQLSYGNQNWSTSVQGSSPSMIAVRNWGIAEGRALTDEDSISAARVVLLGQTVARNLFSEGENPVGATIFVKGVPMEVVGVLAPKGQSGFGQDQDDVAIIPFTTAERKVLGATAPSQTQTRAGALFTPRPSPLGTPPKLTGFVNTIYVQARSTEAVPAAIREVSAILQRAHRIQPGQPDDFTVRNMGDVTEAAESSSRVMALLLAAVASISLVVGGIGIMNILLVSVTERTREIGVRMAIGARRRHVMAQFLVEAVLLSVIGGGLGVLVGVGASKVISAVAGWPTLISPVAIAGGFFFSAAVGVFFGFYPARRASLLNPIEALRYE